MRSLSSANPALLVSMAIIIIDLYFYHSVAILLSRTVGLIFMIWS